MTIYKLDIDQSPTAATTNGVRGVPTLMLFKAGQLVDTKVSFTDRENIKKWISSIDTTEFLYDPEIKEKFIESFKHWLVNSKNNNLRY